VVWSGVEETGKGFDLLVEGRGTAVPERSISACHIANLILLVSIRVEAFSASPFLSEDLQHFNIILHA
jgi:hypothetical protein